jgi:hypothetical protein
MTTPADRETLGRWWRWCLEHPGALPPDVEPVHVRLVRAVGSGCLPDAGPVHLKVMSFPRAKDRLRYLPRALPAVHEATVLAAVRAAGLPCPDVIAARGARHRLLPRLSLLVTRTLPAAPRPVAADEVVRIAAALAAAGVFHPDLHPGNLLPLADGGVAVLDLQSARLRGAPLGAADRTAMAARLLADAAVEPPALVRAGLLAPASLAAAQAQAGEVRRRMLVRRIRRCMRTSTEFETRRRWNGALHWRRGAAGLGTLHGGSELVRWWLGDRAREVLDGAPPVLSGLFRKSWWFPGQHSVYSPADSDAVLGQRHALLQGYARLRSLRRGR